MPATLQNRRALAAIALAQASLLIGTCSAATIASSPGRAVPSLLRASQRGTGADSIHLEMNVLSIVGMIEI